MSEIHLFSNKSILEVQLPLNLKTPNLADIPAIVKELKKGKEQITYNDNKFGFPIVLDKEKDLNSLKLIIKLKKYKNKTTGEIVTIPEFQGVATKAFSFQALADFSFSPDVPETIHIQNFRSYLSEANVNTQLSTGSMIKPSNDAQGNHNQNLIDEMPKELGFSILPAAFSKHHNMYIQKANYIFEDMSKANGDVEKKADNSRFKAGYIYFKEDHIPQPPQEPNDLKSKAEYKFLKACFTERPVWLKNSLLVACEGKLKFESFHLFKKCLSYLAYSFKDGPWKHTYVRFGHDPRGEPESLIYQVIDAGSIEQDGKYDALSLSYKRNEFDTYDPTYKDVPSKRRQLYQLCDIKDEEIKQIISKELTLVEKKIDITKCERKYGWISEKGFKQILKYMKNKFKLT
jgi:hypothetical protein